VVTGNDSPNIPRARDASVDSHPNKQGQEVYVENKLFASQNQSTGDRGVIESSFQTLNLNFSKDPIFFYIKVLEESGEDAKTLKAGKIYKFRVSPGLNEDKRHQGVKIDSKLCISLHSPDGAFEILDDNLALYSVESKLDWYHDFPVKVCDRKIGKMELLYRETEYQVQLRATSIEREIDTNEEVKPETKLLPANISLTENAVALYITPNGREWSVQAISDSKDQENFFGAVKPPSDPTNLRGYARDGLDGLLEWLRQALERVQNCCIAVCDLTPEQICWERLEVGTHDYLGRKAKVVRWTAMDAYEECIVLNLSQEREFRGRQVALVHSHNRKDCPNAHTSTKLWMNDLTSKTKGHPKVLWIHSSERVGYNPEPNLEIVVNFDEIEDSVPDRPFFLFVNAPDSARLHCSQTNPEGIAVEALKKIAGGYMGILCKVPPEFALWVKSNFLKRAKSKTGVNPALFLQEMREHLCKNKFNKDRNATEWLPHSFAYTYYGNPNDVVKITGGINP